MSAMLEIVTARNWDEFFAQFPKGTRYWSYTRFEDYSCPARYKMKRIDRIPESVAPALQKGRIAHAVILAYTKHLMRTGQITDVTAIDEIARRAFFEPSEPHSLPPDAFDEILELARLHAESYQLPAGIVSAEEIWGIPVGDKDVMVVIIDQLSIEGTEAHIDDFKTDWHLRSQADVERDLQLRIYAWAVFQHYPHLEQARCTLRFVRHQRERSVVYEPDDVADIDGLIQDQIQRILGDTKFAPAPGATCQRCGYFDRCPAAPRHADIIRVASEEDAVRVAGEIAVLERQLEMRKAALKDWTAQAGPVTVNGIEWGHFLTEAEGVDDVRAFAARLGERAFDFLSVDARKLKGMPEEEREMVMDLIVDRSRTSFRHRKTKGGEESAD